VERRFDADDVSVLVVSMPHISKRKCAGETAWHGLGQPRVATAVLFWGW
jgi:hypothetical protein